MISGHLFYASNEPEFTIFNKFIIETMHTLFELFDNINNSIFLPDIISRLIENIDKNDRNINYDYFNEKKNEKIQHQSICFSWNDLYILTKVIEDNKDFFINFDDGKDKKIFEEITKRNQKNYQVFLENQENREYEYFFLTKIKYHEEFEQNMNDIIKDNFDILFHGSSSNDDVLPFKKCLAEVLTYVNILHKENFNCLLQNNDHSTYNKRSNKDQIIAFKKKILFEKLFSEIQDNNNNNDNTKSEKKNQGNKESLKKSVIKKLFKKKDNGIDKFFLKRRGVFCREILDYISEDLDFKNIIFPKITSLAKSEIGFNLDTPKSQRIIFCISYIQSHINLLPEKYIEKNYNLLFNDIFLETEKIIKDFQNNLLTEFLLKIRQSEKLNLIVSNDYHRIKNMERYYCVKTLFNKVVVNGCLKINRSNNQIIDNITLELNSNNSANNLDNIQSFIKAMPNFRENEFENVNIIDLEVKLGVPAILNKYFKEMKTIINNEKMKSRFSAEELLLIIFDLENYILLKLYDKLFPLLQSQEDSKFNNKCCRLDFVKPENIIKDKKMINEKLLQISINYIKEMDEKLTPMDKVQIFGKSMDILKKSMTFNSGKNDIGFEDMLPLIIYVVLKSKPKNMFCNHKYSQIFMNPDLNKRRYGSLLTQLGMVMDIIKNMKYTDLIDVTAEQFGTDD